MEAKVSSEKLTCFYHTMRHQIQDDNKLHNPCHENVALTEKN